MKSEMEDQGLGVDAGVTGPGSSVVVRVPYIIDLPHEGFNPSITRWRGRLLMAWRKGWFSARLWLGELSEDHRLLWGREIDFSRIWRLTDEDWLEDPRLIVAGGKVLVAFTFVRHGNIFMALLSNCFASCSVSTSWKPMAAACFSKMARWAPERKVKLLPPPHRPPVLRLLRWLPLGRGGFWH